MTGDDWKDGLDSKTRTRLDEWERNRVLWKAIQRMTIRQRIQKLSCDYPWAVLFFGILAIATIFCAAVRYEAVETFLAWWES